MHENGVKLYILKLLYAFPRRIFLQSSSGFIACGRKIILSNEQITKESFLKDRKRQL
jgi:hypothetical protein